MMNDCQHCRRFLVSGRVQGVFFRASTQQTAEALGLSGHAINLENGDVEVLACGDVEALDQLETWLRGGPPLATVTALQVQQHPYRQIDAFRIG